MHFFCAMTVLLPHAARHGREGYFLYCFARRRGESSRRWVTKVVFQRPATRAIGARAASPCGPTRRDSRRDERPAIKSRKPVDGKNAYEDN